MKTLDFFVVIATSLPDSQTLMQQVSIRSRLFGREIPFSHSHDEFRDFVLARVLTAEFAGFAEVNASEDAAWQTFVPVKIAVHPGLSDAQKEAVEFDYGMDNGVLERQIRGALLPYFLKMMRIGSDDLKREAMVQQIVLLNREDLKAYLRF